jgi:hypothetical protein
VEGSVYVFLYTVAAFSRDNGFPTKNYVLRPIKIRFVAESKSYLSVRILAGFRAVDPPMFLGTWIG